MATHQKKHVKRHGYIMELKYRNDEEGEEYAEILSEMGNCRFEVKLISDDTIYIAKAKGTLIKGPKRERLQKDDLVLLQLDNSTSEKKYYIIHKYSPDDRKMLKKAGQLATIKNAASHMTEEKVHVLFANESDLISKNTGCDDVLIDDDFIANI